MRAETSSRQNEGRDQSASKSLLYVVTEDWFFRSHFLPMAAAAQADGYRVFVACRCGPARTDLEARGLTVLPLSGDRADVSVGSAWRELRAIDQAIRDHDIDITHYIALRPVLIGFVLSLVRRRNRSVYALTGRGFLGSATGLKARVARWALRVATPALFAGRRSWFLFENRDDPAFFGLSAERANVSILGGAGVDPEEWRPAPLPPPAPLRVAFVGRMLRIKGVADLVEAVALARGAGAPIELSLYGEPDPANPASLTEAQLKDWDRREGVSWRGRADDVAAVWAAHHVCVQPSLGGEGLPRALLEAAASGRAIIATDTPGCRDFVRPEIDGLLVAPGDPPAISEALARLAADRQLVERLAAAARRRIFDGFSQSDVQTAVTRIYQGLWTGRAIR